MKIQLNGEIREVKSARTAAELVTELGLPGPALLLEVNGNPLRRDEWPTHPIAEGDQVEILRIAAGG